MVIAALCLLSPPSPGFAAGPSAGRASLLEERIEKLRIQGRYSDAIPLADSLQALRGSDPETAPYLLAEARYLAETVRQIALLPEEDQRELARADSLEKIIASMTIHSEGINAAEEQLEVRRRVLGDEHPDVGASMGNLAMHLTWAGELARADSLQTEVLARTSAYWGEGHPRTADQILVMGDVKHWMDELVEAESLYTEAIDIYRKAVGEDSRRTLSGLAKLGWLKNDLGDFGEAERILRETLARQREVIGEESEDCAWTMNNLGYALQCLNRFDESTEMYRRSVDLWMKIGGDTHEGTACALHGYGALRGAMGDYVTAAELYRKSVPIYERAWGAGHGRLGGVMVDAAGCFVELGRYEEADSLLEEAIRRWPDGGGVGPAYAWRSLIASSCGKTKEALEIMRLALDRTKADFGPDHPWTNQVEARLAYLLFEQGDVIAAEAIGRSVLVRDLGTYGETHHEVAGDYQLLCRIHAKRGDYVLAVEEARQAYEIEWEVFGPEHAYALYSAGVLAGALRTAGEYDVAVGQMEDILPKVRRVMGDEHPQIPRYLAELALDYMASGEFASAEPLLREALAIRAKTAGEDNAHFAGDLHKLGDCLMARGALAEAEASLERCLALEREHAGEFVPRVAKTLEKLGTIRCARGDHAGAEGLFREAATVYDVARAKVGFGMERAAFGELSPYSWLALSQIAQGKEEAAWESVERTAARSLADLLASSERADLSPEEKAVEDSLKMVLAGLEKRIEAYRKARAVDSTVVSQEEIAAVAEELDLAETAWSRFRHEMAVRHPEREGRARTQEEVRASLPERTALVGWLDVERFDGRTESWGYVVRRERPVFWAEVASSAEADRAAEALREALITPGSAAIGITRDAQDLWEHRIDPLMAELGGVENLVVVPSGPLLGIPLEALIDREGRRLGESFRISYAPSGSVFASLAERTGPGARASNALIVCDPPFNEVQLAQMEEAAGSGTGSEAEFLLAMAPSPDADPLLLRSAAAGNEEAIAALPRLRGTRAEAALLDPLLPGSRVLVGPDASEEELHGMAGADRLAGFGLLHIATHALVDDERPEQSALVLSQVGLPDPLEAALKGGRIYDGLLTAQEIVSEWNLDADLVTLSACETGLGKKIGGEGYVGFAHAFFQAGARSLLVSLWKVEDRATALLMKRFYENYTGRFDGERAGYDAGPMPKAEALSEAKRWLRTHEDESGRTPYEHPYYWSAFILIGDPT